MERWKRFITIGKQEGRWLYQSKRGLTGSKTRVRGRIYNVAGRGDEFVARGRHVMVTTPRGQRERGNAIVTENLTVIAGRGGTVSSMGCTTLCSDAGTRFRVVHMGGMGGGVRMKKGRKRRTSGALRNWHSIVGMQSEPVKRVWRRPPDGIR